MLQRLTRRDRRRSDFYLLQRISTKRCIYITRSNVIIICE